MKQNWRERLRLWFCGAFGHSRKSLGNPWEFSGKQHRTCARCRCVISVPITASLHEAANALESQADMMNDEFRRIIAITQAGTNANTMREITGICQRALSGVRRTVPLIAECDAARARIITLEEALNEIYHHTSTTERQSEIIESILGIKP